jgi:hypothetical protein
MARWGTKLLIVLVTLGALAVIAVLLLRTHKAAKVEGDRVVVNLDRPSGTGPGSPPPPIPSVIDDILQTLELGNIAFNSPRTLQRGHSSVIHLVLSATESVEKLKDLITEAGEKEGARIRVSDQMEAQLTGTGFRIEAITPQVQGVSHTDVTVWQWEIEPTKLGPQSLHLTLSVLLDVKGRQIPRVIRTFERTIEVYVEWPQKVLDFASTNWQWLWTTILIPIAGWVLRKRKKRDTADVC